MKTSILPLILILLFVGCDIFSTRTPELPDTGNTFIWTPATSIDYLLTNFTGTLQVLDASNYARVFIKQSDSTSGSLRSYSFNPAPGIDQSSKGIFTLWSVDAEQGYLSKLKTLLPKASKLTVLLSNKIIDQNSATASVSADYTISIPIDPSSTVIPSVVSGAFQLQLQLVTTEQGTKEWRIATWSDFESKSSNKNTWTDLKVKLSS